MFSFDVKKVCQLDGCNRAASANCFCCNKNVCTRHFTEHVDAVKAQIDPLSNEINTMVEKIQSLTTEQITEPSFTQLQQWKGDMHKLIDDIFSTKKKEMEDLIETNTNKFVEHKKQQLDTMIKIQDDVKQLVDDGDATFDQIQILKRQLASVQASLSSFEKYFLSVNITTFSQELVTVSSNLNFSLPPMPQSNLNFGVQSSPSGFSFGPFGGGFQLNPTTQAASTSTASSFGSNPSFTFTGKPTTTTQPSSSTNSTLTCFTTYRK